MDAPANSILFSGPITCTFNLLMKILSPASAKKNRKKIKIKNKKQQQQKHAEGFQILHFLWSFSNDIMAANGYGGEPAWPSGK